MATSIKELLEAGVHFGHQTKYWNPKMKKYIFGSRNNIHVINLDKTLENLEGSNGALSFAKQVIKNRGAILIVGTRSQAKETVKEIASQIDMPYVDNRWLGGMLTNFKTVRESVKKLDNKKKTLESATEAGLSKKEILDLTREINKLELSIGGITNMKQLPEALFVIDTGYHDIAILEARKLGIKVIGIVDTNNDPSNVDYVIPGNDDSAKAIRLYMEKLAKAVNEAKDSAVEDLVQQMNKVEIVEEEKVEKKKKVVRKNTPEEQEERQEIDSEKLDINLEDIEQKENKE